MEKKNVELLRKIMSFVTPENIYQILKKKILKKKHCKILEGSRRPDAPLEHIQAYDAINSIKENIQ